MGVLVDGRTKSCGGGGVVPVIPAGLVKCEKVPFTYNTPSPLTVIAVTSADAIIDTELVIETAFDDPAATLQLGTFADIDLILPTNHNNPTQVGSYGTQCNFYFTVPDSIILTISPGTSTQGSGYILLLMKTT